eukprot:CAMPEP_0176504942 /NCGR_PEP_ID=MMETSP0200_2-20121128/16223_1 /TAXON_ID=947934 /ORGANISM="Chaetoceros sp., Strain GSL56" /LENGTH=986 /DNA_ID=CAMNT_0017904449 /DNA_START=284 /DNA_END=3244 /DNA_ORIENTATION=-
MRSIWDIALPFVCMFRSGVLGDNILNVYPLQGSELGGTRVFAAVTSEFYDPSPESKYYCCFGDVQVDAELLDRYRQNYRIFNISCVSPSSHPGNVTFWISKIDCLANQKDPIDLPKLHFEYTVTANLVSISPSIGSKKKTLIQVIGTGFRNTTSLQCTFGNVSVPAEFKSNTEIECYSPEQTFQGAELPMSVPFAVSNNGIDKDGSTSTNIMFTYIAIPVLSSVDPITVPIEGDTILFVRGENLGFGSVVCKIGDIVFNCTFLSDNEVACHTTSFSASMQGTFLVFLSIDGGYNFYSSDNVVLTIHQSSTIQSIYPQAVPENANTKVRVFGQNFHNNPHLICQFGDKGSTSAAWKSQSLVECDVPSMNIGETVLSISTNGQISGQTNAVPFVVRNAVSLVSIRPTLGPLRGGSIVNLYGVGFYTNSTFRCRFGNIILHAINVHSSTFAQCQVPPLTIATGNAIQVNVEVSVNDGYDFTSNSIVFYKYLPNLVLEKIVPRMGPVAKGTLLTISGRPNYVDANDISCRFQSQFTTRLSPVVNAWKSTLSCVTPPFTENTTEIFAVDVVLADDPEVSLVYRPLPFIVYPRFDVRHIAPSYGSEFGGTNISIYGQFARSHDVACMFDTTVSPYAKWVNKNRIICTVPPASKSFLLSPQVNVKISLNGFDFEEVCCFEYMVASHISMIYPTFGSMHGGTKLMIKGEGFQTSKTNVALCRIGEEMVEAEIFNSTLATCRTPPSTSTGTVLVQITFDQGRYYIPTTSMFTYVMEPVIVDIFPRVLSTSGGTKVELKVTKLRLEELSKIWILFGEILIESTIIDAQTLFFISHQTRGYESIVIRLSVNGQDFTQSAEILKTVNPPILVSVVPPFSHEYGGIVLTLHGSGFTKSPEATCKFKLNDGDVDTVVTYGSSQRLTCPTPRLTSTIYGAVQVELIIFGPSSPDNPTFEIDYFAAPLVGHIFPTSIPREYQSNITLVGSGFSRLTHPLFCQ